MKSTATILIVDDIAANRQLLGELLEEQGYRLVEAADGVTALRLAAEFPPDLVLLDVMMAGMDGYEVCRRLRADPGLAAVPVLMVTALNDHRSRLAGIEAGADDFITKPFNIQELRARVRTITRLNRYRRLLEGQAAQHTSEQNYQSLFDSSRDALMTLSPPTWQFNRGNSAAWKMFGVPDGFEFATYGLAELSPAQQPDGAASGDKARAMIEVAVQDGSNFFEWTFRRRGGDEFPADVLLTRVAQEGKVVVLASVREITERKLAENRLRKERYLLAESQRLGHVGSWLYTPTGLMLWSDELYRLFGVTRDAFTPTVESFPGLLHPDDRLANQAWVKACAAGHNPGEMDFRVIMPDGATHYFRGLGESVHDADHQLIHMAGTVQDITAHQLAENAMRLQSAALEAAANGIVITDRKGLIEWVNPAFAVLTGYSADEAIGRNPRELLKSGAQDPEVYRQLWATILTGDVWRGEMTNRRKDGSHYSEEMTVTPLRSERGEISHFIAIKQDVTARKQAQAVLRESEARYRLLFEENPIPMWVSDPVTLHFMAVNAAAVQHYGYSAAEFLAMTIKEIHPPEDWPAVLEFIKNETKTGASSGESHHRLKNGTIVRVEIISRPLIFGGLPARLVLATDVTEKKLLEEKFLHAQRLESIGMLAAGIAHDLNNVLAPISMGAPILRRCVTAPADLKILNILVQSAERGAKLVKQILGFAHCGAGELGPTQVKHLARDIIEVMEETFPRSIRLEHQIPADLWLVQGNATQIHQVLLNLCVNARDAMPRGGTLRMTAENRSLDAAAVLEIPGARPGLWLVLEIADTGTGIAPALLERIWTPFFTTKGPAEGTGLGLSTVRGIVAGHNGFVELQTEVGHGSTFRVFLPALTSEVVQPSEGILAAASKGQGELILVVDDDAAIRDIAGDILGKQGYSVLTGADGVEAVTLFKAHPGEVSLVITDIDMPRLGGVALAHALHLLQPDLPIIAMSGLSDSVNGTPDFPAAQADFQGFILKPFGPDELLAAVSRLRAPAPVA